MNGIARPLIGASIGLFLSGGCAAISSSAELPSAWDAQAYGSMTPGTPADASSCHPGSVETLVPNDYHLAAAVQGACSDAQIAAYFDACFSSRASPAACDAFAAGGAANASCAACISTPDTSGRFGPLVTTGTLIRTNVAGCVELTKPTLLPCAKAAQAVSGCELAACLANCPLTFDEPRSRAAYDQCAAAADQGGCSEYVASAACLAPGLDGGAAIDCEAPTFAGFYEYAVPLFCGPHASTQTTSPPPEGAAEADASPTDDAEGMPGDAEPRVQMDAQTDAAVAIPRSGDASTAADAAGGIHDAAAGDGSLAARDASSERDAEPSDATVTSLPSADAGSKDGSPESDAERSDGGSVAHLDGSPE